MHIVNYLCSPVWLHLYVLFTYQIEIRDLQSALTRVEHLPGATVADSPAHTAVALGRTVMRLRSALLSEDKTAIESLLKEFGSDGADAVAGAAGNRDFRRCTPLAVCIGATSQK